MPPNMNSPAPQSWEQAVATLLGEGKDPTLAKDCYFDGTALQAAQRYWASEEWQALRRLLPPTAGTALDVGAGRGIASYALARDGWNVHALEPDPSMLVGAGAIRQIAAETGYSIVVLEAYGEKLPFEAGRFDLIIARQALHHARDLPALLRELYRVLRPGGRLIAVRDHVISSHADLSRFLDVHPLHKLYGGENAYMLGEYTAAIRGAGFSLQDVIAPFDSPINYAPLTRAGLPSAIADRVPNVLHSRRFAARLLRSPPILKAALSVIKRIDNRPGRLYSFVAERRES